MKNEQLIIKKLDLISSDITRIHIKLGIVDDRVKRQNGSIKENKLNIEKNTQYRWLAKGAIGVILLMLTKFFGVF